MGRDVVLETQRPELVGLTAVGTGRGVGIVRNGHAGEATGGFPGRNRAQIRFAKSCARVNKTGDGAPVAQLDRASAF